jgi:phosphatidylserine/phosphatidylglycerophosphate/cardiolipin synthase-like enzyme
MSDPIKRTETTHIDGKSGNARCTAQWLLENLNRKGRVTHPITHNNQLTFFICGAAGFADIAAQIGQARDTIDIICWGFDPAMELLRAGSRWPRGATYGDLLIAAGKRGVRVRLLVWHEPTAIGPANQHNMPGYTHDTDTWAPGPVDAACISAAGSVAKLQDYLKKPQSERGLHARFPVLESHLPRRPEDVPTCARREYCRSWYQAAFAGQLEGITLRTRKGSSVDIEANLTRATATQASGARPSGLERKGMVHGGSHHQKPILIDYDYNEGEKAVGYVMGLNSLTDYWDSPEHLLDNPLRERGGKREACEGIQQRPADTGFRTFKPYRDYACRIDRGGALVALYKNFIAAWQGDSYLRVPPREVKAMMDVRDWQRAPSVLTRARTDGECTAQIVRTCAEDRDTSIRDSYFVATDNATLGAGYIYIENQYFQYEEWSRRLLQTRQSGGALYVRACGPAGKSLRDRPLLHVFIVTPTPEKAPMLPRTYDALATLGQQDGLTGQQDMIDRANRIAAFPDYTAMPGDPPRRAMQPDSVVEHANAIDKSDATRLAQDYGIKVCTAMLYACSFDRGQWRYREIYIHSKLMIVDDLFITLGSANLNHRSMAVDSEINISVNAPEQARALRKTIWEQLTSGLENASGGNGSKNEIADAFEQWKRLMESNLWAVLSPPGSTGAHKLGGFVLPLSDRRSSTLRLG